MCILCELEKMGIPADLVTAVSMFDIRCFQLLYAVAYAAGICNMPPHDFYRRKNAYRELLTLRTSRAHDIVRATGGDPETYFREQIDVTQNEFEEVCRALLTLWFLDVTLHTRYFPTITHMSGLVEIAMAREEGVTFQ